MKRKIVLWFLLIAIIFGLIGMAIMGSRWTQSLRELSFVSKSDPRFYRVTKVFDGDTILVDMDGASEKIRLIGVDTPETHDPDVDVQCFGKEATEYTSRLLLNKFVRLESDATNSNRDRYERLLRYVYSSDGNLINNDLIDRGYGFAYTRFPFTKISKFIDSEELARSQGRGLWSACGQIIKNGVYQTIRH